MNIKVEQIIKSHSAIQLLFKFKKKEIIHVSKKCLHLYHEVSNLSQQKKKKSNNVLIQELAYPT